MVKVQDVISSDARILNLSPTNLRGNEPKQNGGGLNQNGGGLMKYFLRKEKRFLSFFEPKLATLLPQMSVWTYFAATFVGALIMLAVLIQNIKDGSLFILSAVLAFVVSPFIKGHFQEKAKHTVQYQNLVKQRDEQLAALDIERNNPPCFG